MDGQTMGSMGSMGSVGSIDTPGSLPSPLTSSLHGAPAPFSFPASIAQMAQQLEGWRGMLPPHLRWQESRPADFPSAGASDDLVVVDGDSVDEDMVGPSATASSSMTSSMTSSMGSSSTSALASTSTPISATTSIHSSATPAPPAPPAPPTATMFSADLDATPVAYPFALDLQVALLRSRYYYTKYLVYKPCLYKAMHHPAQLSHDDAAGAAACLQACLSWPIAMSPTCTRKRLVPCLFFYTQNFLGVLLVLRLAQQLPILQRITATLCGGEQFARAARTTTALCIAWLRDLRGVDRAAEWAWSVVQALYIVE
ncbi:hypothetical protein SPBR_07644 [Sporothrix brasiliensis 5110]|uniref:Transcription factor domain-containing protein n=1 Tax=Sporothrix brasiliensis 5110 TaxID=1398154 RepID=A0A0C2FF37_9PEZI|nr:uncharacterized protein SPBR_07644 [Sporothrix brasiliensis 5110]KIH89713.1 hypothetical protein SPBR_07644 [Sporothrix brasiliensis 5110]